MRTCEKHTLTHTEDSSTMSPGNETQDYECKRENKGTDQVWYFNNDVCGFETRIATGSVHNTITCEKHTLTHTVDSSTMSPGDETQDYECRHENKGTDQVWYFKNDVCGFEAQIVYTIR